ncbi:MAG: hypothetical protein ACREHC_05730, partial [Candidatus Levyibacteriota bacterium]
YVRDPADMTAYIQNLKNKFGSKVMIGEFGAPIPDLNGPMTEDQQADFVDKIFQQLYINRDTVEGMNYWDLTDGSTALLNPDQSPRKVTDVIKKYFDPAIVEGKVMTTHKHPLADILIKTNDDTLTIKTDVNGNYSFPTPLTDIQLEVEFGDKVASASVSNIEPGKIYTRNFVFRRPKLTLSEQIQEFLEKFLKSSSY